MAQMLGVTRPTVNIAGATLQRAGFITYTRGPHHGDRPRRS
jgi:Mn-dependent DtxR family transcriptional regulator